MFKLSLNISLPSRSKFPIIASVSIFYLFLAVLLFDRLCCLFFDFCFRLVRFLFLFSYVSVFIFSCGGLVLCFFASSLCCSHCAIVYFRFPRFCFFRIIGSIYFLVLFACSCSVCSCAL